MKLSLTLSDFIASVFDSSRIDITPPLFNELDYFSYILSYSLSAHISAYLSWRSFKIKYSKTFPLKLSHIVVLYKFSYLLQWVHTLSTSKSIFSFVWIFHKISTWWNTIYLVKTLMVSFTTAYIILQCMCPLKMSRIIHTPISSILFSCSNWTMII